MNVTPLIRLLWGEIQDARAQDRPIVQIRVTADAIHGAPTSTRMTPERARARAAKAVEIKDGPVAIASAESERWLELVIHPEDWRDLLIQEREPTSPLFFDTTTGVRKVFGIDVVEGAAE